jgi:hydroxymethylglutaryl-CoA reductase (NADPH)
MDNLRITPEQMQYGYQITTLSALTTSSSNNASHPANGLAALYAATGQDLANIGESNQCTVYQRMTA